MGKILGSASIDKDFRIYIPKQVREILELTSNNEIAFELDNNKIVIWKNIISRETVRKISQVRK